LFFGASSTAKKHVFKKDISDTPDYFVYRFFRLSQLLILANRPYENACSQRKRLIVEMSLENEIKQGILRKMTSVNLKIVDFVAMYVLAFVIFVMFPVN